MHPELIFYGTLETLAMVSGSLIIAFVFGLPLGVIIFAGKKRLLTRHQRLIRCLDTLVTIWRSIPFMILLVLMIPVTRFLVGRSIGTAAAIVPLGFCAIPFVARLTDDTLAEVPQEITDMGRALGASLSHLFIHILIPEALPGIINSGTLTAINLVSCSAMAGAVGGGGLGDIAVRYGYQRYDPEILTITLCLVIVIVQLIQWAGNRLGSRFRHQQT